MAKRNSLLALLTLLLGLLPHPRSTASQSAASDTATQAKAVLEKNCFQCHGSAQMSGLDLRQRAAMLKGGTRGPAIVPGNPEGSLLYRTMIQTGDLKMPQGRSRLPDSDLKAIYDWIKNGSPWDDAVVRPAPAPTWWSFRKPVRPSVPAVKGADWVRNPIDAFVRAKLEQKGFAPAPRADKRTLLRRAYFDLLGLPPTPEEVENFVKDSSADAYPKLIEKLLASPHYGERWGRHWLDVVRYADSSGYETDFYYKDAWRYRDYVIKSFNEDKPYDRFLEEQIAGDELWPDDLALDGTYRIPAQKLEHLEAQIGTGVYALGPQIHESNMDGKKLEYETLTDAADTTGAAFLGVTMGCARCHNHKFDPLTQRDYYRLQAVFASSQEIKIPVVDRMTITDIKQSYPRLVALDETRTAYRLFEKKVRERLLPGIKATFAPEVVKAYEVPEEKRSLEQQQLASPLEEAIQKIKLDEKLTPAEHEEQQRLFARIAEAVIEVPTNPAHGITFDGLMELPTASILGPRDPALVPAVHVLNRGDLGTPKEAVKPGLPEVLSDGVHLEDIVPDSPMPEDRKALALWMTRADHPLTTRVIVNRIWQWHFGAGIVDTPNDFGRQGQAPTNPELLDWLATEFVARGWSIKSMHRLIMLSNTYQQTSLHQNAAAARIDPENRLLWRMNRRRLEGEALWDAIHSVSGTLNPKMGGRPVAPPLTADELSGIGAVWHWPVSADPSEHDRRGLYILVRRNFAFPMFDAFDRAGNAVSCPKRDITTVAPQALWTLNNRTMLEQSMQLAARLVREEGDHPTRWADRGWELAVARPPTAKETTQAIRLMDSLAQRPVRPADWADLPDPLRSLPLPRAAALVKLCLAIFNLNEFAFVD